MGCLPDCRRQIIAGTHTVYKTFFRITAEIHARSLAICRQTHEFEIHATRQRGRAGNLTICYRKKQIDVSL